ncbi:M20/M25/M40 family metallo-hydrolase [Cryobacterium sp. TMS1-13-1]|uniref:M20/M25/M40 family metallo-hydrolase n=1 Tax=Cryobacterium sp. TMS1-13-1 TaxID=1259220 RepID=UPI0010690888|nr:M20/M25/M40 family metallo-hydrolase [Cryobacterium sp. TMS1-13-1]TFD20387.1 M20/M25/M40 family metallo-hydrolase [Cryobacterium sp. TMS1-13-1]
MKRFPSDPVAILQHLVRIDSVNPDLVPGAAGEAQIAIWCSEWLLKQGFQVTLLEQVPGRPSVVGIKRGTGGGRSLMLNAHLDTVGVATYAGDPFSGDLRAGRVYGRGAVDTKSGLAAILVAAARASAVGLAGDVIVTLVADEEFGSIGTEEVLRTLSADAALVIEPSSLELTTAHRGFAWFELCLTGLAAHGSQPELGVDAIWHAGLALRALDELRQQLNSAPAHATLGHGAVRVSKIVGGDDAATVAARCVLTLERRMLPGESSERVESELWALFTELARTEPQFRFELTRLVARAAFEAEPHWPILRALSGNAERVLGPPAKTRGEPFWTDAGLILEAGIPCVVFGADGEGLHADTEWVDAQSVRALAEILEGTITEFCGPTVG